MHIINQSKKAVSFLPVINSTYNFNPIYRGQLLIKATFSGSLEWPWCTGFTIFVLKLSYVCEYSEQTKLYLLGNDNSCLWY